MQITYDLNTQGCLIIRADIADKNYIRECERQYGEGTLDAEHVALQPSLENSELCWIAPWEIGALTDAPILGVRDDHGEPIAAWGFMDYQVRSFLSDLLDSGKAVFIS